MFFVALNFAARPVSNLRGEKKILKKERKKKRKKVHTVRNKGCSHAGAEDPDETMSEEEPTLTSSQPQSVKFPAWKVHTCRQYIWWSFNKSTLNSVHFNRNPFTCLCEGGKKALTVSIVGPFSGRFLSDCAAFTAVKGLSLRFLSAQKPRVRWLFCIQALRPCLI